VIQLSEAGELGGSIVAIIPHKDAYMLAATVSSLWVVRGDPTADGSLQNISRDVGIVGPRAWCRDHLDRYYFLSSHGLYTVSASGDGVQGLSDGIIPEQLSGVTDVNTVLEYDHATRSVRIYIPSAEVSWLFEADTQTFWPFNVDYDGSLVAIGPLQMNDKETYGRLLRVHGITASGSADVKWNVLVADSAEQVSINAKSAIEFVIASGLGPIAAEGALEDLREDGIIQSRGTWTAGVNHRSYPRARGLFMILLLYSSGAWAWEGAVCFMEPSGKWR
jgi:hypothetical protein